MKTLLDLDPCTSPFPWNFKVVAYFIPSEFEFQECLVGCVMAKHVASL